MKRLAVKAAVLFLAILSAGGMAAGASDLWRQGQSKHRPYGVYEKYLKRPFDFILSVAAMAALSPFMFVTALAVRIKLGKPVIFKQQRPGKDGKVFTLYKFRTMADEKDEEGNLLPDEKRLAPFGKMLRSTSLDELPELYNISKGDMSIVGPRPLLVEYLPRYNGRQKHRHDVRPGLTGLAQVSGRNSLSWEEKFEDDVKYVGEITFLKDLEIILRTAAIVFKRTGISSGTSVTMEEFFGNVGPR